MEYQGDCRLEPLDAQPGRGVCLACDPDGCLPLLLGTHRTCGKRLSPREQAEILREMIEADIATDVNKNTRTMEQIRLSLDKCFGGCKHMNRWCRRRGHRQLQEAYQAWLEHLLEHNCTPE